MPYSLVRTGDGAGDSGLMSDAVWPDASGVKIERIEHSARPQVGAIMRVGSFYARTYQMQDWWQTTIIEEVISDTPKEVVFRTTNSTYTWKIL